MRSAARALAAVVCAALCAPSAAQTYSTCNPLQSSSCPPDSALGKSVNIDFTSGASDSFTASGNPTYDRNGASFTVAKSGDSPQLTSKWYIMFGRVDVTLKAAPGAGIVSSFVLQSDDLDEIDWEWLGADASEVQTNYFGKGQTTTYDRAAFVPAANNQGSPQTYTVIWTASQVVWKINGNTVRTLEPSAANNQYPQTPMQLKIGAWSGGDPSNPQGTVEWARGPDRLYQGPVRHAGAVGQGAGLLDGHAVQVRRHVGHLAVDPGRGRQGQLGRLGRRHVGARHHVVQQRQHLPLGLGLGVDVDRVRGHVQLPGPPERVDRDELGQGGPAQLGACE